MNIITLFSTSSGNSKDYDQKSKDGDDKWKMNTEEHQEKISEIKSQPLINLGLGIGGSTFCNTNTRCFSDDTEKDSSFVSVEKKVDADDADGVDDQMVEKEGCRKVSVVRFTEEQMEELKRQLIIFKYIVWGLPVPFQLLLPVWKSFNSSSSSSSSSSCDLHHRGSSPILLELSGESLDYLHVMNPEPGRCRRTDGKKWRCHQPVIPNEKYCEKHMHRGCKRSRKLVEPSPYSCSPNPIRCRFPATLDKVRPSAVLITTPGLINSTAKLVEASSYATTPHPIRCEIPEELDKVGSTSVMIRTPGLTNGFPKNNENDKQKDGTESEVAAKEKIAVMKLASGLDFSPKSVLQNGIRNPTSESQKMTSESEFRCNRTDGKKWRCKKEIVPNQKYCAQHLIRRKVWAGKPSLSPSASVKTLTSFPSASSARGFTTEQGLNTAVDTSLKISLPSRLADLRNANKNNVAQGCGNSSSSEATESDEESTGVWDVIALSP